MYLGVHILIPISTILFGQHNLFMNGVKMSMSGGLLKMRKLTSLVSITILAILFHYPVYPQADPLTARGIDPEILDVMVSSLSQDLRYRQQADIIITTESEIFRDRALVIYNPDTEYGIDLYMKFEEKDIETMSPRKFRKMLEKRMMLQHRLKTMEFQYDPKTIKVESQDGDSAVITFRYSKFALPQPVAWMRFLNGRVWVEGDQVKRIQLMSDEGRTFMTDGMKVSHLQMNADFVRTKNGQDLLDNVKSVFTARYYGLKLFEWGEQFTVTFNTRALQYMDVDEQVVYTAPEDLPDILDDSGGLEVVRAKLDRKLPIWGNEVRKMGFDLPRPWGASLMYTDMSTLMDFTSFEINGQQEAIEAIFDPNGSGIDVTATVPQVRGDLFVLPFLNLMVLAGTAEATGSLKINTTELGQIVGLPDIIEEDIGLNLTMAGVGVAVAGGYKNFFAAIAGTYMLTLTEGANTESTAIAVTPLVGYQMVDYRLRFLAGAEWLDLQKNMEGSIVLGNGEKLAFNIGVESEAWGYRVGVMKEFGSHWESLFSYTWGDDRDGWTMMVGYRW